MDIKSLSNRKRQKKIKTDSDKGNAGVLVVPPDILKKLGISIGNSNSDHQISNINNTAQTIDTVNNESTATNPTSNINKKSSESSCLETANLMKKSVFLSPSFVPTLANLSSGEVEISNIHNDDDSKMATETFSLESMKDKSVNCNGSKSNSSLAVYDPISGVHNIKTFLEITSKESQNLIQLGENKIVQEDLQITSDDCVEELVKLRVHNSKSTENRNEMVDTKSDSKILLTAVIEKTLTSLEGSADQIQKTEEDNNLIHPRATEIQLDESNSIKKSTNTLGSTQVILLDETNNVYVDINSLDRNIIKSKKYEIQKHFSSLMKAEIQQEPNGHKLNSNTMIKSEYAKKQTEIQNNLFAVEEKDTKSELDEAENNLISLEGIQIEFAEVESDIIGLRNIDIDLKQSDSDIIFLENIPIQNELAVNETNTISLEGNTVQLLMSPQNMVSLESETVSLANCAQDLLVKDGKTESYTEFETNHLSDVTTVSHIITSLVNDNEQISQIPEPLEMKQINNNNILNNGSVNILDMVPVNRIIQRINIISEEIIPPSDLTELRNLHSPIMNSLTPVPLNSVIAPKRTKDYASETTVIGERNLSVLPNKTEVLPSDTKVEKNTNRLLPHEKVDPISNTGPISVTSTEERVATQHNSRKTQNKDLSYLPIIDKGDLKNNNDIFNSIVIGASTVKCNEHFIEGSCKKYVPILNEDLVSENNKKSDLVKPRCIEDFNTVQKYHNTDNEQNIQINCYEIPSDINSSTVENSCKEKFVIDQKSTVEKKDSRILLDKKKRKKKKAKECKNIDVTVTEDSEFYKNELEDIVKSSKENSDTNTHQNKVKEIAEYIKRYAHIYKDKKIVINKDDKKHTIHSKTNMTKSKLCIQGVEKPGGYKSGIEGCAAIKVLKTYTRQKKIKKPSTSKPIIGNDKTACDIYDATESDLNTVNISMSYKQQDFCLCYDFGRLDASDYDNSYEHIHFWLHDHDTDLDSILSIYNDEEIIHGDRTKLGDIQITEVTEINTKSSNICWNYFMIDKKETSIRMQSVDDSVIGDSDNDILSDIQPEEIDSIKNHSLISNIGVQANINEQYGHNHKIEAVKNDTPLLNSCNGEVITIVEIADNQNIQEDLGTTGSVSILAKVLKDNMLHIHEVPEAPKKSIQSNTILKGIRKVVADPADNKQEDVHDRNNEASKPGTSKSKSMEVLKEVASSFASESSKQGNRKRCLPVDPNPVPCSKKNIKCGVCNKLLSALEWNRHVEKKHNFIAWKVGQSFNFDDPELLKNLRQKFETVGSLKCSICYIQTTKFNKFIGHIKTCFKLKESSSRRASSSADLVVCGVCHQNVQILSWNEHIGKEHDYLAWIAGQDPLNLDDEAAVSKHLQNIIKCDGSLKCSKCGLNRKRVKLYLAHIETCDGSEVSMNDSSISADMDSRTIQVATESSVLDEKIITCGVCKQKTPVMQWTAHISKEHNYLAWEDGSTPLNLDDEEAVRNHLLEFIRNSGGLRCHKCGLNRKRVKLYLSHMETCEGDGVHLDQSGPGMSMVQSSSKTKTFECGVCEAKVSELDWNEHIGREHNYLAWKVGATSLDVNDQDAVKEHLLDVIRSCKGLICYKCGLSRRRVSNYLSHIRTCDGSESNWDQSTSSDLNSTVKSEQSIDGSESVVKCGVCGQTVSAIRWITHIGYEHTYLAWQEGQQPLDLNNEEAIKEHLLIIARENNGLICNLCGVIKKYPKSFQTHVRECTGPVIPDNSKLGIEPELSSFDISEVQTDTVTCGVCDNVVMKSQWVTHVEQDHDYLAWLKGRPPLDLNDQAMVQKHLIEVARSTGGLKCKSCGLIRKYAKTYLQHVEHCRSDGGKIKDSSVMKGKDSVSCAVCSATLDPRDWRDHAMKKHYNVAWLVGASPIEINNPYGVEPYIKEYAQRHNNKLVCKTCGISRVSAVGFYAHIITCGKTEEETDIYKNMCEICNNKYLRIYKSQHMTMHREKELAVERKLLIAKEKVLKQEEDKPVEIVGGRRRAAEKAKNVIEKYTSNKGDGSHCSKCGFASEVESEMLNHVCVAKLYDGSESDESVNTDYSSEEDDDTDIDSNISDEEREARDREQTKSKKHGDRDSYKLQRLPYQIKNLNSYMRKSAEEYAALHLTNEDLFSQYRNFDYKIVSETELFHYMPPLEESCKIRYGEDYNWVTYKRFEAKREKDIITMFTGGCILNMCWVPPLVGEQSMSPVEDYLSILTSLAPDKPRHAWDEQPAQKPAIIQIWDCGNLTNDVPEFVMALALDCGTIWSIDWCPSGARDVFDPEEAHHEPRRLGLLAAACANGSVYVFTVPHPSTIKEKGQNFYKLKPVVELRLTMDTNRTVYQATAIKWSTQKGHAQIVVGYANGTTGFFDLKNESPLLKYTENNVDIVYPYHDERSQGMCIEDVDVFPSAEERRGVVAVAGSVGGAGTGLLQAHAAAARVLFPPHWPAALLAGDDNLVSQAINELEWYGLGRRVGGLRAVCGCTWCGRLAAASAPLVRLMRTHPAYNDLHRQVIAVLQMVALVGSKRKRKNDELSMIMEPLTYHEAISKYGIELKHITAKDKNTQQKLSGTPREAFPERFPLADVTAMAFCPSSKNHHKLAMATHAGVIFILNV